VPELPDITVYLEAIERRVAGGVLERLTLKSPFLLRSFDPPLAAAHGRRVLGLRRLGKRIVWVLEEELFLVLHLMIAGRLHWKPKGTAPAGRIALAAFEFTQGTLLLTEASKKKRASLHLLRGEAALQGLDPGGIDVLAATPAEFESALRRENHTLKRALTDPHLFSGIGNAYSDEILHRARLSPLQLTHKISAEGVARLQEATVATLRDWIERLRQQTGDGFPEKVTAFRPDMAVHGRFGQPCPDCGTKVQRIVYAENEANYCPSCQTGGKLLADRALSKLLKDDWPRTLEEMEERRKPAS
jgi:formamidopyrimidine-DNA glycosylase